MPSLLAKQRQIRKINYIPECPMCRGYMSVIPAQARRSTLIVCGSCDFAWEVPIWEEDKHEQIFLPPEPEETQMPEEMQHNQGGGQSGGQPQQPQGGSQAPEQGRVIEEMSEEEMEAMRQQIAEMEGPPPVEVNPGNEETEAEVEEIIGQVTKRGIRELTNSGKNIPEPVALKQRNTFAPEPYVPTEEEVSEIKTKAFYHKIGSILKDNSFDRLTHGHKSGKFYGQSAHKLAAGRVNVFSKKEERKGKAYNVCILVDTSGSMGGQNIEIAAKTAWMLVKGLIKHNVRFSVIGFNERARIFKDWHPDKQFTPDKMRNELIREVNSNYSGGTGLFLGLYNAEQQFQKIQHEGGQNILVVVTDGSPGGAGYFKDKHGNTLDGNTGNLVQAAPGAAPLKTQGMNAQKCLQFHAKRLSKESTVVPIGIGANAITDYFPKAVIAGSPDEAREAILVGLKKAIKRV